MNERELAAEIVEALGDLPGLSVEEVPMPGSDAATGEADLCLRVAGPHGEQLYAVEIEARLSPSTVDVVLSQLQPHVRNSRPESDGAEPEEVSIESIRRLLFTHQITDGVADRLVSAGLEFADAAGNAYLNSRIGYVLILGKRKEVKRDESRDPFTPAGLKVAHALLTDASLREKSYREIARAAGVSLGAVGYATRALRDARYLVKGKTGALRLFDAERLQERWELGYVERLRPALAPSSWRMTRGSFGGLVERSAEFGAKIGGEFAAAHIGMPLRPQTATVYIPRKRRMEFAVACRLLPIEADTDVQVFLLDDVGGERNGATELIADPLLIRAELLAIGGERLRAIADEIRHALLQENGRA